jgi:CCR4-NOT transcription complex subunit 1
MNINTLLQASQSSAIDVPDESIQDKIHFIFNNLSAQNMDQKERELKSFLQSSHHAYLSQYLVVKRASIEPNFHGLYLSFLSKVDVPGLLKCILQHTYGNILVLLQSEKVLTQSSERSLLKNLGSWLGALTIEKNRPVLMKDLDLKGLLLDAFDEDRLLGVIPFVSKVMEPCGKSKAFRPPNPWVMALMSLLKELYTNGNLKLNLKFEIEVLARALDLELKDVPETNLLDGRTAGSKKAEPVAAAPPAPPPQRERVTAPPAPVPAKPAETPASTFEMPGNAANLQVSINSSVALFTQQPNLRRQVPVAIDCAIREIITPVVERSVTIACITTRELVVKDFAMEPDEEKMRAAAHTMVQNLAGSLALVTCKEPLRVSMGNHLRARFQGAAHDAPTLEQAVQVTSAENLEVGCNFIEKAAVDKAIRDIDEALSAAYARRKQHRETTGAPYYDMTIFGNGRYPAQLPEPLRPKPGGLSRDQLRVYEDFSREKLRAQLPVLEPDQTTAAAAAMGPAAPVPPGLTPPKVQVTGIARAKSAAAPVLGEGYAPLPTSKSAAAASPPAAKKEVAAPAETFTLQQALSNFGSLADDLDAAVERAGPDNALDALPEGGPVHVLISKIQKVVTSCVSRDECGISISQRLFKRIYDNDRRLPVEAALAILETIKDVCKKVVKELTTWVTYQTDDARKYHKAITAGFIRSHLLNLSDFDSSLTKSMDGGRGTNAMDLALHVLRTVVIDEQVVTCIELSGMVDGLGKIASRSKDPSEQRELNAVVEAARKVTEPKAKGDSKGKAGKSSKSMPSSPAGGPEPALVPAGLRDQIAGVFSQWVTIHGDASADKSAHAKFMSQLQQAGYLNADDMADQFFRVLTELAIEGARLTDEAGAQLQAPKWATVDAFAALVVLLVKYYQPAKNGGSISLLTKVFAVVVRCLHREYDAKGRGFNSRGFFRLFVNWLVDLNAPDPALESSNYQVLQVFSNTLHSLRPQRLPGFAFAWLELVSHRMFMPKLLLAPNEKGWPLFQRFLIDLFQFLEPSLRTAELTDPIRLLYRGSLRVLLVLLHDFPEFLADYHFSLCNVIPVTCIQMRNLILSAFPRNMRLPDPFTPNLKVDLLPEINQSPRILSNTAAALGELKAGLDSFLSTRQPSSFLVGLNNQLLLDPEAQAARKARYRCRSPKRRPSARTPG